MIILLRDGADLSPRKKICGCGCGNLLEPRVDGKRLTINGVGVKVASAMSLRNILLPLAGSCEGSQKIHQPSRKWRLYLNTEKPNKGHHTPQHDYEN